MARSSFRITKLGDVTHRRKKNDLRILRVKSTIAREVLKFCLGDLKQYCSFGEHVGWLLGGEIQRRRVDERQEEKYKYDRFHITYFLLCRAGLYATSFATT